MIEAQGREWARLMLDEHMALRAALEKRVGWASTSSRC